MADDPIRVAEGMVEAFNDLDWPAFAALLDPDVVYEETGTGARVEGAEPYLALCQGWKAAFPDVRGTVVRQLAGGETVVQEVLLDRHPHRPARDAERHHPAHRAHGDHLGNAVVHRPRRALHRRAPPPGHPLPAGPARGAPGPGRRGEVGPGGAARQAGLLELGGPVGEHTVPSVVVAALIPRFPLLIALRRARRSADRPVALGPQAGAAQVVGLCTAAAEAQGVRPGLRVGEALARCPDLELVVPDPDATAEADERVLCALEDMGAAVEPVEPGVACFAAGGLGRLHGGPEGVLRRARAALPVGADGRLGAAPSRFAALQAAREAPSRRPLMLGADEVAAFLAPSRPSGSRSSARPSRASPRWAWSRWARWPRSPGRRSSTASAVPACGPGSWPGAAPTGRCAHAGRRSPCEAAFRFPEPVAALPALEAAARLLLGELAGRARGRGRAVRALTLRARLADGGSWTRALTLREATADAARLATAALPRLGEVAAPVEALVVRVDASGHLGGRQLTVIETAADERGRRAREAVRQVRAAQGPEAVLRLVELEPWSRLPERRWALAPYDGTA